MTPYRQAPPDTEYTAGEQFWFRRSLKQDLDAAPPRAWFDWTLLACIAEWVFIAVLATGCVHLAHVPPATRDSYDRERATVRVESYCSDDVLMTSTDYIGSGVVISERHVLTAAHVVECTSIARVYITLYDGTRHRAYVVQEDQKTDIAKLEIAHAGRFGLDIAPPLLAPAWWGSRTVCAYVRNRPPVCGPQDHPSIVTIQLEHGDSGAAVYDDAGRLVGLVRNDINWIGIQSGQSLYHETRITIVSPQWLSGT